MLITASIVTYNTSKEDFDNVTKSVLNTNLNITLFISDNSEKDTIKQWCHDKKIIYIFNNSNRGYGAGHNVAIKKAIELGSCYHFVINPDISFESGTLEKLVDFMESKPKVGLCMPKILCEDGSLQYVCKLLPTPFNLFLRGFASKIKFLKPINDKYELRYTNYDHTMLVPYISGCFMMFRTSVFSEVGFFDENIFMYLEETDISRRIFRKYDTVMYPEATVFHKWEKGTHKSKKLRNITIQSAIYYFNKYGWFFDKERRQINKRVLNEK